MAKTITLARLDWEWERPNLTNNVVTMQIIKQPE